jgi:hypothetical protein
LRCTPNLLRILFISFLTLVLSVGLSESLKAQTPSCKFTFKGTLAGKQVTFCFYPDENDGNVSGHYYYGSGNAGTLGFNGTAVYNQTSGIYAQKFTEYNVQGNATGYFVGTLKKGVMQGTWTSTDGKKAYKYNLVLQR